MVSILVLLQVVAAHPVVIGDRAPDQALRDLAGKSIRLPERAPAVVSFFATWCEPCHAALADLLALRQQGRRFTLVLIAVGEPAERVRRFVIDHAIPRDVVVGLDETAVLARAWGQDRFPTSFVVDKHWTIRHINRGYGRGFRGRIERWLPEIRDGN